MAAAVTPTLHGQELPMPEREGYTEEQFLKGAVRRMANGSLVRDLTTTNVKTRFTLGWIGLTTAQRTNVETALGHVKDGTARTFLSPRNLSYTVVLAEDGEPQWQVYTVRAGLEFRYSGELVLEEV